MLMQLHRDPATGDLLPLLDGTEDGWRARAQGIMATAQAVRDAAPGTVLVGWDGTWWYRGTRGWASGDTAAAAQAAWQAQEDAGWPMPWRRAAQASMPGVRGTRGQSRKAQRARSHCPTCSHPWRQHRGATDGHPTDFGWCSCTATRPTTPKEDTMTTDTIPTPQAMAKATRKPRTAKAAVAKAAEQLSADPIAAALLAAQAAGMLDSDLYASYLRDPSSFKLCGGWPKWHLMAHAAPKADFPRNAANPDGLAGACRPCNAAYRQLRKAAQGGSPIEVKLPRDPQAAAAAIDTQLKALDRAHGAVQSMAAPMYSAGAQAQRQARQDAIATEAAKGRAKRAAAKAAHAAPVVVDGTAAQAAEHAALDAKLAAVGGVGTDQGQAILADAADQAKRARMDARNERQRAWRAARKAQAADLPTTKAGVVARMQDILR